MSKNVEIKITDTFEIGGNAQKSIRGQIDEIISDKLDKTQDEETKKTAIDKVKAEFEARGQQMNAHDKGQNTGIFSFGTLHKMRGNCYRFGDFCRKEYKAFSLEKITPQAVTGFLEKISSLGYAANTVNGYISSIEKLGSSLDVGASWHEAIMDYKKSESYRGLEHKDTASRAYGANADKIINAISNPKAQLAAEIAKETGLRRGEVCHFNLNGSVIACKGKNGMEIEKPISNYLRDKLNALEGFNGRFDLSPHTLSHCWDRACRAVGVEGNGIHGLRHDKAQADVKDALAGGRSVAEACKSASEDLSHHRERITWTYLR